jgi:hypothetical protein
MPPLQTASVVSPAASGAVIPYSIGTIYIMNMDISELVTVMYYSFAKIRSFKPETT